MGRRQRLDGAGRNLPCAPLRREDRKRILDARRSRQHNGSTLLLGFAPSVQSNLYDDIAYDLSPISLDFVVPAANRRLHEVRVKYDIYNVYKRCAGSGYFTLRLQDGVAADHQVSFTPPAYGWYTAEFQIFGPNGQRLTGLAHHLGVTPPLPHMPQLTSPTSDPASTDPTSTDPATRDAQRQRFAGLLLRRTNTQNGLDALDQEVRRAKQLGLTLLVQFTNPTDCTPDAVQAALTRFAGRIRYWEILNEPDQMMSPAQYLTLLKPTYALIKQLDPGARVLAPALSSVNLEWLKAFYDLGGKDCCDALSVHDYQGNESLDPGYWHARFTELRALMTSYGDGEKPIWQTGRAIGGCGRTRLPGVVRRFG